MKSISRRQNGRANPVTNAYPGSGSASLIRSHNNAAITPNRCAISTDCCRSLASISPIKKPGAASSNTCSIMRRPTDRVDSSEMRAKGLFVASFEMRACGAPS